MDLRKLAHIVISSLPLAAAKGFPEVVRFLDLVAVQPQRSDWHRVVREYNGCVVREDINSYDNGPLDSIAHLHRRRFGAASCLHHAATAGGATGSRAAISERSARLDRGAKRTYRRTKRPTRRGRPPQIARRLPGRAAHGAAPVCSRAESTICFAKVARHSRENVLPQHPTLQLGGTRSDGGRGCGYRQPREDAFGIHPDLLEAPAAQKKTGNGIEKAVKLLRS